jgi:CHAD domain-containing protein
VKAALAQVAANIRGAIEGRDAEYLHQLRVGIRRLRTVLRIFKAKRLDRRLRKLAQPLGEARDWDVFVARYGRGKRQQREAHARCRPILESWHFPAGPDCCESGNKPLAIFAARSLDRLHRKALKRARGIDWYDEDRRHRVRIAVRRLRYACDFFSACFVNARPYLRSLELLQDLLGELNDIAVARRLGGVRGLEKRESELVIRLAPAWKTFEKVDTRKLQVAAR